jgi:phosphotriesterase-related protein
MLVEFLRAHGADLSRVIIDHIDRTIFDDDRLFRLADAGVVLEWGGHGYAHIYKNVLPRMLKRGSLTQGRAR